MPASESGNSQADYYRQRGPTEVPSSHRPGIGNCTKAVDNDGGADDPMARDLRAHPWRNDQEDGDTGPSHLMLNETNRSEVITDLLFLDIESSALVKLRG